MLDFPTIDEVKKKFIENNLLKVLDYLPANINVNNKEYYLYITKLNNGSYSIFYSDNIFSLYFPKSNSNLIDVIIYTIEQLDKYIPNFANNLINI